MHSKIYTFRNTKTIIIYICGNPCLLVLTYASCPREIKGFAYMMIRCRNKYLCEGVGVQRVRASIIG